MTSAGLRAVARVAWAICIAGGLTGCGAAPAPSVPPTSVATATPAIVAAGTPAAGPIWRYTLLRSELQRTIPRDGQYGIPVEAQGRWLLLEVQVENVSQQAQIVHAADFQIVDGQGHVFPADEIGSATYSLRNRLARFGGEFRVGMSAPLGVVFDVDPEATPVRLALPQAPDAITVIP